MARPEPGGDSSSPSGNTRVLSITRSGTIGEHLKIVLADGSSFSVAEGFLAEHGLAAGDLAPEAELVPESVNRLREAALVSAMHERALRLLAGSSHTAAGLKRKLLARGAGPRLAAAELERLTRQGLIDDRAFAGAWVRQRLERHPEGAGPLTAGLQRHGVARELAEEVVHSHLSAEAEREGALALIQKLQRRTGMTPQKLADTLFRRGFRRGLIRELLQG